MIINESRLRSIIREEIALSSTRLSLRESASLNEGMAESAKGLVQSAISAAVEYGIAGATAGAGAAGPAQAAETAIDLAFSAKSIVSTLGSLDSMLGEYKEIKELLDQTNSMGKIFAQSKDRYYETIKKIVRSIVKMTGGGASGAIEKIKGQIQSLISRLSSTIGDAIKVVIPDAAIGLAAATLVNQALQSLGDNCYDLFSKIVDTAGKYAKNLFDPAVAMTAFDEMYPKVIETIRTVSEKINDPKFKAFLIASTAGAATIAAIGYPKALNFAADKMQENQPMARRAVEVIVKIAMPTISAILAVMQMIMKGELAGPDRAAAPEDVRTESRARDYLDSLSEEISSIDRDRKKLILQDEELEELGGYDVDRPAIPGGSGSHDDGYEIGSVYEDDDTFKKIRLARLKASGVSPEKAKKMAGSKLKHRGQRAGRG